MDNIKDENLRRLGKYIADALIAYRENGKHENPYVFGIGHSMSGLELFTAVRKSNDNRCWVETNC